MKTLVYRHQVASLLCPTNACSRPICLLVQTNWWEDALISFIVKFKIMIWDKERDLKETCSQHIWAVKLRHVIVLRSDRTLGFRIAEWTAWKLILYLAQQPGSVPHLVGNVAPGVKLNIRSHLRITLISKSTARQNNNCCGCAFFPEGHARDGR